jgi:hypothetical protein
MPALCIRPRILVTSMVKLAIRGGSLRLAHSEEGNPAVKKKAPLPGPKKKENLKTSVWIVDRCVGRPVDHHRLVGHPGQASGSAAGVAGRSSGRRLVADRPVGFADWTSIGSLF